MTAVPSIVVLVLTAAITLAAGAVSRRKFTRRLACSLAALEFAMAVGLGVLVVVF